MIARDTMHIVFAPMIIGIAMAAIGILYSIYWLYLLSGLVFLLSFFFIIFFRDPARSIGRGVVSPADGKVMSIDEKMNKVSIFMRVHDVHVNRAPAEGVVLNVKHYKGSHVPAFKKDSQRNERVVIDMKTRLGDMKIIQIAGIIARRIVPYVRPHKRLKKGQRIGIIRLGSRVDLYLPKTVKIITEKGNRVYAGTTQIGAVRHELD
jgi:phosphatidylserine decarboxylase